MTQLKLIVGAIALEGRRAAGEHLYSLLVLTPLVLGMTYFGVGRMVEENAALEPSPALAVGLAVAAAAALVALSMSRASAEIYHVRTPESLLDTLPVGPGAHLGAALLRRAARTAAVGGAALVGRSLVGGGTLVDASLWAAVVLFVCVMALGEALAALEWIHWWHRRERLHAAVGLAAFAACAWGGGLLLLLIVKPEKLTLVSPFAALAGGALLAAELFVLVRMMHAKWRASDIEFAKRLGTKDRGGTFGERVARRLKASSAVRAQLARDLQLTLRGFSSAVYTSAGLAALWLLVLAAVLTTGMLPGEGLRLVGDGGAAAAGEVGWFEATWLPPVLAVKFACVAASVSLVSLVPVLVAHQSAHLWLERAVGVRGAEAWRAKLWYARLVSTPAPVLAWAVGALSGEVEGFYLLPLLGEAVWLWWLVSTLAGALAFEMPTQPGLALVLMGCIGLAAGGFVAFLWPMGLAVYAMGMDQICMRGQHRAHLYLYAEGV
jgi:hypothetical protein